MKISIVTCMLLYILLTSIPALGADFDVETQSQFVEEFGISNTVVFAGLSTTIPKSAFGATIVTEKNPWLAFGLSVIVPGLGQFYNGQPYKGVSQLALILGGYTAFYLAIEDDIVLSDDTVLDVDDDDAIGGLGVLVTFGATLWSLIDAPISANNINQKNQLQAHQDKLQAHQDKGYSVSPLVKRDKFGATFAFQF